MILNPLIVPPVLFGLMEFSNGQTGVLFWRILGTAGLMYCVAPLAYLIVLLKRGAIENIEARDRKKRQKPLFLGVAWLFLSIPVMAFSGSENQFLTVLIASVVAINSLFLALINRSFKISIHSAAISGLFAILLALLLTKHVGILPFGGWLLFGAFLMIPAVAWARIRAQAHQPREVFWGIVLGITAPVLEIYLVSIFKL